MGLGLAALLLGAAGCGGALGMGSSIVPARATAAALSPVDDATFARAKAEGRLVLLEGGATWCRFCVAMETTTYRDPAVRALIDEHFITVKVDIEARPDIEQRYAAYGWPATIIFAPDAREIGRYTGYIPPAEFATILRDASAHGS